jgi:hypothetical protein
MLPVYYVLLRAETAAGMPGHPGNGLKLELELELYSARE